jgi:TonB family protein
MKKTIHLLLLFVLVAAIGKAQNGDLPVQPGTTKAFVVVEEMPQFGGGKKPVDKFFADNIKYPESSKKNKEAGTVYVQFVVDSTGKVVNPKVIKGVSAALDAEAIRLVSIMPDWIPGKQGGKTVNVVFTLPVKFKLTKL